MWSCFVPPSPGRTAQLQPTARPYFAPQETQSLLIQGPSLKPRLWNSPISPGAQGAQSPGKLPLPCPRMAFVLSSYLTLVLRVGSYMQWAESKNRVCTGEQSRAGSSCLCPMRMGSPVPALDGHGGPRRSMLGM